MVSRKTIQISCLNRARLLAIAALLFAREQANADALLAWGYNFAGQIGNGNSGSGVTARTPTVVNGMSKGVTSIGAGTNHSLAIRDGVLYAWGANSQGQLADGTTTNRRFPQLVPNIGTGVSSVAAGTAHSVIVTDGAAIAWGSQLNGILGNGTSGSTLSAPVAVSGLGEAVTVISSSAANNLALKDGAVYAWGTGYLGNGSSGVSTIPVTVSTLSSEVTALAAGGTHFLAIRDGAAVAWGSNQYGQLGTDANGLLQDSAVPVAVDWLQSGVTAIAAGDKHSLAVKDGNVYVWGKMESAWSSLDTQPVLALDHTDDFVDVAAGLNSYYALSSNGSIWAWGANSAGELGLGHTASLFAQLGPNGWTIPAEQQTPPTGYRYTDITAAPQGRHVLATVAPRTIYGDANLDGIVDFDDLLAVAQHYDTATGATWTDGDFNLDKAVNFSDLLALAQHYGTSAAIDLSDTSADFRNDWALALSIVPEPASISLLLTGTLLGLRRRR